jgi:hypothetical protein
MVKLNATLPSASVFEIGEEEGGFVEVFANVYGRALNRFRA